MEQTIKPNLSYCGRARTVDDNHSIGLDSCIQAKRSSRGSAVETLRFVHMEDVGAQDVRIYFYSIVKVTEASTDGENGSSVPSFLCNASRKVCSPGIRPVRLIPAGV